VTGSWNFRTLARTRQMRVGHAQGAQPDRGYGHKLQLARGTAFLLAGQGQSVQRVSRAHKYILLSVERIS
jgi:hypothetical protein